MLSSNHRDAIPFFNQLQQAESGGSPEKKERARIQFIADMQTAGVVDPVKLVNTDSVKTWFDNLVWLTYKFDTEHDPAFLQRVKDARKYLVYTIQHEIAKDVLPDPPLRVVDISNEPDNEPGQLVIDLSNETDD